MKTKATKCYKGRACIKENFSGDDVFFFRLQCIDMICPWHRLKTN